LYGCNAKEEWQREVANGWESGEPGILHYGNMNKFHNTHYKDVVLSTNPCGEVCAPAYGSCDLGSINLVNHVKDKDIDWDKLRDTITVAIRFLDNVLDMTMYPLPEIELVSQKQRRIGLGVMGLHHMMILCGKKYDSDKGIEFIDKLFYFIKKTAYEASCFLAVEKGVFSDFNKEQFLKSGFVKTLSPSVKAKIKEYGIRNCSLLSMPPTGTTSMVAGVSAGSEPVFAPAWQRKYYKGENIDETTVVDPIFQILVDSNRSTRNFVSAADIEAEWHLKVQATIQKHVDSSVSKTINFDGKNMSKEELGDILLKYIDQLKGVTVYRIGSRGEEPLKPLSIDEAIRFAKKHVTNGVSKTECSNGSCEL
jgi:ribonucleoside-diphosphate reductase alpha chain